MIIHDFDMARYLLEDEPISLYDEADVMVDPAIGKLGDVDTTVVTLKVANGTVVVIDDSRKAVYGYDQRIEAFGSKRYGLHKESTGTFGSNPHQYG